jgi:hypothetical protein
MNGYFKALSMDRGFLGVLVVAFSPHMLIWKLTDISVIILGVNFALSYMH